MNVSDTLVLLLQTGFVLLVVLAIGAFARRSPALQSTLYRLGIVAVLALVIGSPWLRERPRPVVPVEWTPSFATATVSTHEPATPAAAIGIVAPTAVAPTPIHPLDLLVGFWLTGVAVLTLYLGLGFFKLARMRRACREVTEPEVLAVLEETCRLAKRPIPALLEGEVVGNPFVAGICKPAIYLPVGWHQGLDREVLQAVLRHEVAHVANGDLKWNLVHRLACIALWPQLLLWLLRKPMNAASEQLCDR